MEQEKGQTELFTLWKDKIPFLPFKDGWEVKPVPAFFGAVVRFQVQHKDIKDFRVSVYLDCYEKLGYFGGPYWEVYPVGSDTARYSIEDTEGVISAIDSAFKHKRKPKGKLKLF